MINILIADDHTLLAESLSMVLEKDSEIRVVATAHDGNEAVEKCSQLKPDVVLLDIKMPVLNGIEAARLIKKNYPDCKVAILTSLEDDVKNVINSLLAGADAYLLKDTLPDRLKALIKCIYWGFSVFSGNTSQLIKDELLNLKGFEHSVASKPLKMEDIEIIKYIGDGKNNSEIGKILGYAEGTVKNRITKLMDITGVDSRAQLVMFALKNNLI